MALPERLSKRILYENDCWVWTGALDARGYGKAWWCGKPVRTHRISYEAHLGPVPDGLVIDHLCRNKACMNPAHLEAVPQGENVRRGDSGAHWKARTHCPQGHEYTPENTYAQRGNPNWRCCKTCQKERSVARRKRMKENSNA